MTNVLDLTTTDDTSFNPSSPSSLHTDLPPPYHASIAPIDSSQTHLHSFSCQAPLQQDVYALSTSASSTQGAPTTPLNNRGRTQVDHSQSDGSNLPFATTKETLRTPRKRSVRVAQSEQASSMLKVNNSPSRCSPSKRGSPISSSSPSRQSSRESVLRARPDSLRPPRRRSRTSSGTAYITQGLASATVHCDSDISANDNILSNDSDVSGKTSTRKVTRDDSPMIFGGSTYQAVKMGLSKYTPLLKPQWLLSEPWKAESTVAKTTPFSEPEYHHRGHRRSKASESINQDGFSEIIVHQGLPGTSSSFLNSPPLTAKEDVTKLTPADTPNLMLSSPSLLGPAFAGDVRSCAPCVLSVKAVRRPVAARATRGRSITSHRSLTEVAQSPSHRNTLFSKRCRRLPFASLSNMAQISPRLPSVSLVQKDLASPADGVGGLGIVCVQDTKPLSPSLVLQSPLSSLAYRKGSIDSISSTASGLQSPANSTCSSVPSIVVTPPAVFSARHLYEKERRVQREGIRLEYPELASSCSPDMATPMASAAPASSLQQTPPARMSTPLPIARNEAALSPSEEACLLRSKEDERGIATFKVAVDAILSDYFVYRTVTRTWRLAHQLIQLVLAVLGYKGVEPRASKRVSNVSSPAPWSHEASSIVIPSLCAQRYIVLGDDAIEVPPQWGADKLQTILKLVMDHIVTGMVALVTDDRAPYETPVALGHLCRSMQEELPTFLFLPSGSAAANQVKNAAQSPVTSWVRACASVDSPDSLQGSNSSCSLNSDASPGFNETEWHRILQDIDPREVFLTALRSTIQATFDKGEGIRSKANLLAVPPPRKGSRKKWQAANAEMNAQKALREEEIAQVTCGAISVSEFRRRERKRAAVGSIKDNFAAFFFVRFVGELYNSRVLDVTVIRQWLQRFFFNTVFPGVPSSYELEAGCALLITVGETLDEQAGTFTPEMKRTGFFTCPDEVDKAKETREEDECDKVDSESLSSFATITVPRPSSSAQASRADDVPANHWILVSPRAIRERYASGSCHGRLISDDSLHIGQYDADGDTTCNKTIAERTVAATMARLKEILAIREVHAESRVWCREVMALRNRFWIQYDTGTSHKVGHTIRKMKKDFWGA